MTTNTQTKRIPFLLIDDDEALTQVLSRALKRRGFESLTAHSGAEAKALFNQYTFDKALLDLKMERESGLSLIPELKTLQADLAIVVLTGYSSVATAVEAVKLGALNYLCKPANTDEILTAFGEQAANAQIEIPEQRPSVDRMEWEHIQKVLHENEGNISASARVLGMHRRTLQRKLNKRPVKQ
jgi:two-component system response regulator RegA